MSQDLNPSNHQPSSSKRKCEAGQERLKSVQLKETDSRNRLQRASGLKLNRANLIVKSFDSFDEKYEISKKLGEGSFGEVFQVIHKGLNCPRALKIIRKSQKDALYNTYEELEILKKLDHPNVLKIYEYFETENQWLIITEFFQGRELFDEIIEGKRLSERNAALIFIEICKALAYIHSHQIVHRDLKPQNILVKREYSSTDQEKHKYAIKLIDWGLGSLSSHELSRKCGTPEYCAPEVIKGEYDYKCDLWSLGILLYVMLGGRFPFKGECVGETLLKVSKGVYHFRGPEWQAISEQAKDLIRKLLLLNPNDRMEAQTCLKHEWILRNSHQVHEEQIEAQEELSKTLQRLKEITIENKFTAVIFNFIRNYLTTEESTTKLKQVFDTLDENNDGVLSYEELLHGYTKIYGPIEATAIVEDIFKKIDLDCSGKIQYSEFLTFAGSIAQDFTLQQLEEAFKLFDRDGNGRINKKEINELLSYEKGSMSKEFDEILAEIDLDGNGSIDLQEFIQSISKAVKSCYPKHKTIPDKPEPWSKERLRERHHPRHKQEKKESDEDFKPNITVKEQSKSKHKSKQKGKNKSHSKQKQNKRTSKERGHHTVPKKKK